MHPEGKNNKREKHRQGRSLHTGQGEETDQSNDSHTEKSEANGDSKRISIGILVMFHLM